MQSGNTGKLPRNLHLPDERGECAGFRRQIGNGRFTLVIAGINNATTSGNYNLYVNVPDAGCAVALAPTAAGASIGGRVMTSGGKGISKATITLSGGSLGVPIKALTNAFGYYSFDNMPVGENYVLTISRTKTYVFANPTRVISLENNIADADFVSER